PRRASAVPRFAVVVVFPTPPLPDVTTMARPSVTGSAGCAGCCSGLSSARSTCISTCLQRPDETPQESWRFQVGKGYEFAFQTPRDLVVDRAQAIRLAEHDRLAL